MLTPWAVRRSGKIVAHFATTEDALDYIAHKLCHQYSWTITYEGVFSA